MIMGGGGSSPTYPYRLPIHPLIKKKKNQLPTKLLAVANNIRVSKEIYFGSNIKLYLLPNKMDG